MITDDQLRIARKRLGLTLTTGAEAAGVLSRCIERKVARLMWNAVRMHSYQDVCSACLGSGLVPKADAPATLPLIPRKQGPGSM